MGEANKERVVDRTSYKHRAFGDTKFRYGYPTGPRGGTAVAQWLFDDADTPMVDVVNGIELVEVGDPAYETAITGDHALLTPQIDYDGNDSHSKASASSDLNVGANDDMVVEFSFIMDSGNPAAIFYLIDGWGARGFWYSHDYSGINASIRFEADDGTKVDWTPTISDQRDDAIHKSRIVFNHDGTSHLHIDGVQIASGVDTSSLAGKAWTNEQFGFFEVVGGGYDPVASGVECRICIGTDVLDNNSGGPGGG